MSQIIDIGDVLEKSGKLFKNNINFCLGAGAIFFVVTLFLNVATELVRTITGTNVEALVGNFSIERLFELLPIFFSIGLISLVVSVILKLGLIKVFLNLVDGGRPTFNDLWSTARYLPEYFGAVLLMAMPVIIGFALFVIPGFYLYVRWQFFSILIIDKNLGPIEALKESWRLTRGRALDMFLAFALMTALVLAGSLAVGIGLIVTLPLSFIFLANLYRILNPIIVSN